MGIYLLLFIFFVLYLQIDDGIERIERKLNALKPPPPCSGNCGSNHCDTNGCTERTRSPVPPSEQTGTKLFFHTTGQAFRVEPCELCKTEITVYGSTMNAATCPACGHTNLPF